MKTKKTVIFAGLIAAVCTVLFFSCHIPVGLGERLDVTGPVVDFTYPEARTAVLPQFYVTGTASDSRSDIDQLLLKAELNNSEFPKQWRYKGGSWEVSEDYGASWSALGTVTVPGGKDQGDHDPEWNGSAQNASWKIPIDMTVGDVDAGDGEYLFTVQTWDSGGFTDDTSFKTRVFIIDNDPPLVDVTNPYLYKSSYDDTADLFTYTALQELHAIPPNGPEKTDPTYIGKFLTQAFRLQWQIEENLDVRYIDLRFYKHDEEVDGDEATKLSDDYIFSYSRIIPAEELTAENNVKPNGSLTVPALNGAARTDTTEEGGTWDLKNPIATKTTIKVAALCYDAADNVNLDNPLQEKVLGYFIYWPEADEPWITFPDGMKELETYDPIVGKTQTYLEDNTYLIYPGRKIRATAFHAYGLKEVTYSLWTYTPTGDPTITSVATAVVPGYEQGKTVNNEQKPNGGYSTVFQWDFEPPARSGYIVIKAQAKSDGNQSQEYQMFFRVQDITFPNFPVDPFPIAGEPLYKAVKGSGNTAYITVSGYVSDATEVKSLNMVWINPMSRNYAAMSQLEYFRDSGYAGWTEAQKLNAASNGTKLETENASTYPTQKFPYDPANPNRLWNLKVDNLDDNDEPMIDYGQDLGTGEEREATYRQLYKFSVNIPLSDLFINMGSGPYLTSQVFLLKVENPEGKTTIITYAPQGDVLSPVIKIDKVEVLSEEGVKTECTPNAYKQVPQFIGGEKITVTGTWTEDSTGSLAVQNYLYNNMEFEINGQSMTNAVNIPGSGVTIEKTPSAGTATTGTFTITANVGTSGPGLIATNEYMKDTLVVSAFVKDIGGNPSENMASWLVESDTLRFLRISSDEEDTAYSAGKQVEIYIEFNKPVKLKEGRANPVLVLNTAGGATGIATYGRKNGTQQTNEAVRQYFTYTVGAGQNVARLNVRGISVNGGSTVIETDSANAWRAADYPFAWEHTPDKYPDPEFPVEEIRLTRVNAHTQALQGNKLSSAGAEFYARALPVSENSPGPDNDYVFTLKSGKNITVDTTGPTITSFTASPADWHGVGVEINITATFSENLDPNIATGAAAPYLTLSTGNATEANRRTSTNAADIRVNNNRITFKYTVKAGDNTAGTTALTVTGFGGQIRDVPGTAMTTMGTPNTTLTGVYLDTTAPDRPSVAIGTSSGGTQIATASNATANRSPNNQYGENVWVTITGNGTGDQNLGRIEYSLNGGLDWTSSTTSPVNKQLLNNGLYDVQARQFDKAGNGSGATGNTSFNWDKGALITSISSVNNGSFTRNDARQDVVSIQVNLRKKLSFTGTPQITLNTTNSNGATRVVSLSASAAKTDVDQLTFEYAVVPGDTTSGGKLNVTNINLGAATDGTSTVPAAFLSGTTASLLAAGSQLADQNPGIFIVTGAMNVTTGPTWAGSATGEEWTGTITVVFNRPISKGSGEAVIQQSTTGYRLPAVLTEAQSSRYRSAAGFNTYYTRGTNGFIDGSSDTSTKFVLNYENATVVDPANTTGLAKLAWDFRTAETVRIPVTSQDVSITNTASTGTLVITLTGSNALQVLGASHTITIPASYVQDNLGWPVNAAVSGPAYTTPGVNKAFIRVDKQVNKDTVAQTAGGNATRPYLTAEHVLQTTARLDCRTPNSFVRYRVNEQSYSTTSVQNPNSWGGDTIQQGTIDGWRGGDTTFNYLSQLVPDANNGTNYSSFTTAASATHLTVGNGTETDGYVWRIAARGRNSETGTTFSEISEEIALRTVLTVEIASMTDVGGQIRPGNGDNLWIRGGDADSSSSVPGFPLTWDDNFNSLSGKRAGIRLLRFVSTGNSLYDNSIWRWVSWEVNVRTYFNIFLGRDTLAGTTAPDAAKAWQYGPRLRAALRGGWATKTEYYTLYPGKHRWLRLYGTGFNPGGELGFVSNFISRPDLATSLTQP